MSHELFKRQVYAGLLEIVSDPQYYHYSGFGEKYCKFTDEGKEAVLEYLRRMSPWMLDKEKQELDKRAKALVVEELKK